MRFYVQFPDNHVEIWGHNKWFFHFVLPGTECAEPFSGWCSCPIDGSNHNTTLCRNLKAIYDSQPKQLSFFDEVC